MHLEQIEQRLDLFKDYLAYTLEVAYPQNEISGILSFGYWDTSRILKAFRETGYLMCRSEDSQPTITYVHFTSFDDWLFHNGHYDLVDYTNYPPEEGLIDYAKNRGISISYPFGKVFMESTVDNSIKFDFESLWGESAYGGSKLKKLFTPNWSPDVDQWGAPIRRSEWK